MWDALRVILIVMVYLVSMSSSNLNLKHIYLPFRQEGVVPFHWPFSSQ